MASGLGRTYRARALDFLTGRTTINGGTILVPYLELSSTTFAEDGTGGTIPLVGQWNNYARVALGTVNAAAGGIATNSAPIAFATPGSGSGFTASYWALYDAPSGGTMIAFGAVTVPTGVSVGVPFTVAAGGVNIAIPVTGGITIYGANRVLDVLTGKTASSASFPSTFLALYTTQPANTGTTTASINELAYTGYARVALSSANLAAATVASPTVVATSVIIAFPTMTSTGPTAPLVGFGIVDCPSGAGNMLIEQPISGAPTVNLNGFPQIASGSTLVLLTATP